MSAQIDPHTELDVVNLICERFNESPVDSIVGLDPDEHAAVALSFLRDYTLEVLEYGFSFNMVVPDSASWAPDVTTKRIKVPANLIEVTRVYDSSGSEQYIIQNGYVYNPREDTFDFSAAVIGEYKRQATFDELPPRAKRWVMWAAVADMHISRDGDDRAAAEAMRKREHAWDKLCEYDDTMANYGLHNDKYAQRMSQRSDNRYWR